MELTCMNTSYRYLHSKMETHSRTKTILAVEPTAMAISCNPEVISSKTVHMFKFTVIIIY